MTAQPLLVVTTRSRLRGPWLFPAMFVASRRIRRQLAATDGLVVGASIVAGPTEFWTITVWRSRHLMQEFMRSGAHGEIMWRISRWLRSFWLFRWRPGTFEVGSWGGVTFAPPPAQPLSASDQRLADIALAGIPHLRAAMAGAPAAGYDSAPLVRRQRRRLAAVRGLAVRIAARPLGAPIAVLALHRLARRLRADHRVERVAVGVGRPGEAYLLAVGRAGHDGRLLPDDWQHEARARWGDRLWAGEWLAESEFGSWDGLRLRRRVPAGR